MHWYRSSRQAVGWNTYFFPPESDCFCWRPVNIRRTKRRRREGRQLSQYGLVSDTWIKWLFSPDGKVKANPSSNPPQNKKKGATQINEGPLSEWNILSTVQGQSICKQAGKMISHHRAKLFWCASVCPPLSSLIHSISSFYGPWIVGPQDNLSHKNRSCESHFSVKQ